MSDEDIDVMIKEDGGAETTCDFCREQYLFSEDDLSEIKDPRAQHATT